MKKNMICLFLGSLAVIAPAFAVMPKIKIKEYTPVIVEAAKNDSSALAVISDDEKQEGIPNSQKNYSLLEKFKVPFVSIKEHMNEYVKNIPFAPEIALRIETIAGLFRIWESEAGILCAPDPKAFKISSDDWKTNTLLKINNQGPNGKVSLAALRLLLLINKHGQISLKAKD